MEVLYFWGNFSTTFSYHKFFVLKSSYWCYLHKPITSRLVSHLCDLCASGVTGCPLSFFASRQTLWEHSLLAHLRTRVRGSWDLGEPHLSIVLLLLWFIRSHRSCPHSKGEDFTRAWVQDGGITRAILKSVHHREEAKKWEIGPSVPGEVAPVRSQEFLIVEKGGRKALIGMAEWEGLGPTLLDMKIEEGGDFQKLDRHGDGFSPRASRKDQPCQHSH